MQNILDTLFYQHSLTHTADPAALHRLATNTGMLKKGFNEWQRRRFLHIIDDKDLLAYNRANDSFVNGIRFGVLLMMEVFAETNPNS